MTADSRPSAHRSSPKRATASATTVPVGAAFEVGETELFDIDGLPYATGETRTVGEMLADVDRQARLLLFDIDGDRAGGLVRSWPAFVAATDELWSGLPCTNYLDDASDQPMRRLIAHAESIDNSLAVGWPGFGSPDPDLTHMTETLRAASSLVGRYGPDFSSQGPAIRHSLLEVRTAIMHSLHLAAHACSVALHSHGRDRYQDARQAGQKVRLSSVHSPYVIAPTTRWVDQFAAAEAITGRCLGKRSSPRANLVGTSETDPNRLRQALAGWDIQAHRTLTNRSCAVDNVLISRTQALVAGAGLLLLQAAPHQSEPERLDLEDAPPNRQLAQSLQQLGRAMNSLASRWADLAAPTDRPDPRLLHSAAELRAAYCEITHDATAVVPPAVIARRPGFDLALQATLGEIEIGQELTDALAEKTSDPSLTGRARALSHRAHNDIEAGLVIPHITGDVVWVSPADIHARRMIELPTPVRQGLERWAGQAQDAGRRASSASTALRASGAAGRPTDPEVVTRPEPPKHLPLGREREATFPVPRFAPVRSSSSSTRAPR